jgi:hypothetical protein
MDSLKRWIPCPIKRTLMAIKCGLLMQWPRRANLSHDLISEAPTPNIPVYIRRFRLDHAELQHQYLAMGWLFQIV